jgi:hypothetical protein
VRITRRIAFVVAAVCLVVAAVVLLAPTRLTFSAGPTSSSVDCGSPAFPRTLIDFASADDAANCVGQTSASIALYAVLLAGLGLGLIALTSRDGSSASVSQPAVHDDGTASREHA